MTVVEAEPVAEPVAQVTSAQRARRKPPPRVLILRCDRCGKKVKCGGYLKIDRQAVAAHKHGQIPVYWQVLHSKCDIDVRNTDFSLRTELFSTTSDLLEATAYLLRNEPWIIRTNWHGLIGKVLADTREYADIFNDVKRQAWRERRREKDGEKRNGISNGNNGLEEAGDDDDD